MLSYLTSKSPDYSATSLDITPVGDVIAITPKKAQKTVFTDSGSEETNSFADNWFFTVSIPWVYLSSTDKETILDFYFDSAKANCCERSFVWEHPTDGNEYVAYFKNDFEWSQTPDSNFSIPGVVLKIVGYYGNNIALMLENIAGTALIFEELADTALILE